MSWKSIKDSLGRVSEVIVFPILWWKSGSMDHWPNGPNEPDCPPTCKICQYETWRANREARRNIDSYLAVSIVITKPSWLQRLLDKLA